jgi:hypothetical protein
MDLESLRRGRRILSALVSLSAIALVMAKVRGPSGPSGGSADAVGAIASLAFVIALALLVLVWRKEHVASEAAFAARAAQQLATMKLQLELAKKKQADAGKRLEISEQIARTSQ